MKEYRITFNKSTFLSNAAEILNLNKYEYLEIVFCGAFVHVNVDNLNLCHIIKRIRVNNN